MRPILEQHAICKAAFDENASLPLRAYSYDRMKTVAVENYPPLIEWTLRALPFLEVYVSEMHKHPGTVVFADEVRELIDELYEQEPR